MTTHSMKTCPRCLWNLLKSNPARNAISRRDGETEICKECGMAEAFEDSNLRKPFLDENPSRLPYWNIKSRVWLRQEEEQLQKRAAQNPVKEDNHETQKSQQ